MGIPIVRTLPALRSAVAGWKAAGQRVGVVPTMGALHAGHLSLARAALATSDRVIVTLFVNPRQFDNPDDLAAYPRTEDADAARLAPLGIDLLYAPDPDQIYPPGFATTADAFWDYVDANSLRDRIGEKIASIGASSPIFTAVPASITPTWPRAASCRIRSRRVRS